MPTIVPKTKVRGRTVESNSPADSPRKQQKPSAVPAARQSGKTPSLSDAISSIEKLKAAAARQGGVSTEKLTKLSAKQQSSLARGEGYRMMAIDRLGRSPFNRDKFDSAGEEQMKESVREKGILQPLTVRHNPKYRAIEQNGAWRVTTLEGTPVGSPTTQSEAQYTAVKLNEPEYEIIAGERRWRAATALHLAEVPVLVRSASDRDALEVQAVENLQREDLNPIDEAIKYQQLLEVYKSEGILATEALEMVTENLNVSKSLVYQRLKLIQLPPEAKEAVLGGRLPGSHGDLITRVDDHDMQVEITRRILQPDDRDLPDEDDEDQGETLVANVTVMSYRVAKRLVDEYVERLAHRTEYNKLRDEFAAVGKEILTAEQNAKLFRHDHGDWIDDSAPYVSADEQSYLNGRYRKWREALGKKAPPEILAQSKRLAPVVVYDRNAALAVLKAKQKDDGGSIRSTKSASEIAADRAHKARVKAFTELLGSVAEVGEQMDGPELWRLVFENVCSFGGHDALHRVFKRRGVPAPDQKHRETEVFLEHFKNASGKELRGLVVELLIARYAPSNWSNSWGEKLLGACKALKVELKNWDTYASRISPNIIKQVL